MLLGPLQPAFSVVSPEDQNVICCGKISPVSYHLRPVTLLCHDWSKKQLKVALHQSVPGTDGLSKSLPETLLRRVWQPIELTASPTLAGHAEKTFCLHCNQYWVLPTCLEFTFITSDVSSWVGLRLCSSECCLPCD